MHKFAFRNLRRDIICLGVGTIFVAVSVLFCGTPAFLTLKGVHRSGIIVEIRNGTAYARVKPEDRIVAVHPSTFAGPSISPQAVGHAVDIIILPGNLSSKSESQRFGWINSFKGLWFSQIILLSTGLAVLILGLMLRRDQRRGAL